MRFGGDIESGYYAIKVVRPSAYVILFVYFGEDKVLGVFKVGCGAD